MLRERVHWLRQQEQGTEQQHPARQRFDDTGGREEPDPVERLRFFCSLAMNKQDWLDVEAFFDDVLAERQKNAALAASRLEQEPAEPAQELKPLNGLTKEEALAWARGLRADSPEYCSCGDRLKVACPGEWEPGCDLGNNPRYEKRVNLPSGCAVCGLGGGGEVTGYVCQRGDCPTRVTCGGSA
jgi:hypothetical protein